MTELLDILREGLRDTRESVGQALSLLYGESPSSEWVAQNAEQSLCEGGQPREWRDRNAPDFQPSLMQQQAYPDMLESTFVGVGASLRGTANMLLNTVKAQGGKPMAELWKRMRMTVEPGGQFARYISDKDAVLKLERLTDKAQPLGRVLAKHDELYKELPEIANVPTRLGEKSYFDYKSGELVLDKNIRSPEHFWHEFQHVVSEATGLPRGTSPDIEGLRIVESIRKAKAVGHSVADISGDQILSAARKRYRNNAGERLARVNSWLATTTDPRAQLLYPVW